MVEKRLRNMVTLQEAQDRKYLINELAAYPEETLKELIPLLERQDAVVGYGALEVIQAMPYPQSALALPVLIDLVADRTSPLQLVAIQTLVGMGTAVLPALVTLQRTYRQQVLMAANRAHELFLQTLDPQNRTDPDQRKHLALALVRELAQHPDDVLPALAYVLTEGPKSWWQIAIRTLSVIGYPKNRPYLPLLIAHAAFNDVGVFEAVPALLALGPEVVVPYLLDALYQVSTETYRGIDVKDLCTALSQLGNIYAAPCGPLLCSRFGQLAPKEEAARQFPPVQPQDELEDRISLLLLALKEIGPECAPYALPVLLDLSKEAGSSEAGLPIREFLATFERSQLEPYALILQTITPTEHE